MPPRKNELTLIGDLFGDPLTTQQPTAPAKPKKKAQEVTKAKLELIYETVAPSLARFDRVVGVVEV